MTSAVERGDWRPSDTLALRFIAVRTAMGKDRKAFAALTGLTENQLQSIEAGRSPRDLAAKINRVHLATGVDRNWLMWGGPLGDGPSPEGNEKEPPGGIEPPTFSLQVEHLAACPLLGVEREAA